MARNKAPARLPPKQARSKVLVDAIIQAGQELWLRDGPETTTNAIAERAGVSVGSLYRYFSDKYAIFDAVADRYGTGVWSHWQQFLDDLDHIPMMEIPARILRALDASEGNQPDGLARAIYDLRASGVALPSMDRMENEGEHLFVQALLRRVPPTGRAAAEPFVRVSVHSAMALTKAAAANFKPSRESDARTAKVLRGVLSALVRALDLPVDS